MLPNPFEYTDFSKFLHAMADSRGKRGGIKSEMARAMSTHPAYLSRVLNHQATLSLEQAERLLSHFKFNEDETRYLLLLLQEERAGTAELKRYFRSDREAISRSRLNIKQRIPKSTDAVALEQGTYYSSYIYQAVHVLASIPEFGDEMKIATHLKVSPNFVREAVSFLERHGILLRNRKGWKPGVTNLHLGKESHWIKRHHANWRLKAMTSLEEPRQEDLHYSGAFSMSREDAQLLKNELLQFLKQFVQRAESSKEEAAYCFDFDFFEL